VRDRPQSQPTVSTSSDPAARRLITVLSILYNSAHAVDLYIRSWALAVPDAHLKLAYVFVDHGTSAGQQQTEVLRSLPWREPAAVRVHTEQNTGFTGGVLAGVARIDDAQDILLLNPDIRLPSNFWIRLSDWLGRQESETSRWAGAFPLFSANGDGAVAGIGLSPSLLYRNRPWPVAPRRQILIGPSGGAIYVPATQRSVVLDFWPPYFAWGEDADTAVRAHLQGVTTRIIPIPLEHLGGHSVKDRAGHRLKARLLYRNRILFWVRIPTRGVKLLLTPVWCAALVALLVKGMRDGTFLARLAGLCDAVLAVGRGVAKPPPEQRLTISDIVEMRAIR
jgi:N-acetylglucosaminyl-diphospho-decaprenol L-rhamnosyltransferase